MKTEPLPHKIGRVVHTLRELAPELYLQKESPSDALSKFAFHLWHRQQPRKVEVVRFALPGWDDYVQKELINSTKVFSVEMTDCAVAGVYSSRGPFNDGLLEISIFVNGNGYSIAFPFDTSSGELSFSESAETLQARTVEAARDWAVNFTLLALHKKYQAYPAAIRKLAIAWEQIPTWKQNLLFVAGAIFTFVLAGILVVNFA